MSITTELLGTNESNENRTPTWNRCPLRPRLNAQFRTSPGEAIAGGGQGEVYEVGFSGEALAETVFPKTVRDKGLAERLRIAFDLPSQRCFVAHQFA